MPASSTTNGDGTVVLASSRLGQVVVPQPNRLKRLNYFDGKFLRATDLQLEQDHLRPIEVIDCETDERTQFPPSTART